MRVVATLAAYNEALNIRPVIETILHKGYLCVVVDDGSRDATAQVAQDAGAIVVRHAINLGQGYAFLSGLKMAVKQPSCEIVVSMDADGQHRPEEIPLFVEVLQRTRADVVVGSRVLKGDNSNAPFLRRVMLPYVTLGINRLSGYRVSDAMCGFRAFRASSVKRVLPLLDQMLEPQYIAVEMFIRFGRAGLLIEEVPVHVDPRSSGVSTKGVLRYGSGIMKAAVRTLLDAEPRGNKSW
jgi:glycosyltransferase involved in cell wall biosynthesis